MGPRTIDELKAEGFSSMQIYIIRQGYERQIDPSPYMDVRFTWEQMEEIRQGIIDGVDISVYALPETPAEIMQHIREKMMIESGALDIKEQELARKRLINLSIFLGITGGIALVVFLLFAYKDTLALAFENLSLELSEDELTLEYKSPFNAADYIDSYTEGKNVRVILPENIDTEVLGSQTAVYKVTNGVRTATKNLIVNVVDTEPPILAFTTSKVTIKAGDTFRGKAYIDSITDNHDGDLKDSVICSTLDPDLEKQKIHFEVSDSSGNKTEETLLVLIEPLMEGPREAVNDKDDDPDEKKQDEVEQKESKPAATPAPTAAPAPAHTETSQPSVVYEEYEETYSYEENGGVTTCTVHHGTNGTTSQSCEWIGPWEEYD